MTSTSRMNAPTHAPMTVPSDILPEEELDDEFAADGVDEDVCDGVCVD